MSKQKMGSCPPEVQPPMGLETLLSLDGEIFPMDCGYWTKLEAKQVVPTEHIPHGIKYCLTLHDQHNNRVLGFDNAHGVKSSKRFGGRCIRWDHKHNDEVVLPYEFETAAQLLEDFWKDVAAILQVLKGK